MIKNRILALALFTGFVLFLNGQTQGSARIDGYGDRLNSIETSDFQGLHFNSIGPTVMSGRVVDMAVDPVDPSHFYVAYASGGLWETINNGQSFEPLFDDEAVMTIGAIAINWDTDELWVGTGEVNSSRSSYSGVGIYHSNTQGEDWSHVGLTDSHHIGKIIINPENPKELWVASLGPLYSDGGQRGVYHTLDGGEVWQEQLAANMGAVDLVMHPSNPKRLYAATWDRKRSAWDFKGHGPGSAIYETMDGGVTWKSISSTEQGFAGGDGLGRIGLTITEQDGKTFLYAILDNQSRRTKLEVASQAIQKQGFKEMTKADFLALDESSVSSFLKDNGFPAAYDYSYVKKAISQDEIKPSALYDYLSDANADLFDTPVIGPEIFSWNSEERLWSKTHDEYIDDLVYSYGYYFGLIHVREGHGEELYVGGVPLLFSENGGKNWTGINPENVHADHHALWANPNKNGHLINGNDGGINISYDNGVHWSKCNSPAVGQFYTVAVDNADPYRVYGGLQDNGVWRGPNNYEASNAWHQSGDYPYDMIMGGDGMQIAVDPRDNETVYTGYQFGHYYRIKEGEQSKHLHPRHALGESPLRWNWQTPILMSSHNPDIIYMCSNKVHRSMDKGEQWTAISADLSLGGRKGNVPFGTITSIDESPFEFGQLIVGTDDGHVWISQGTSEQWNLVDLGNEAPKYWVSRVIASRHAKGRYYVSLNGYRNDDMRSLLYRSDDSGATWRTLMVNVIHEPVNVIHEDALHDEIVYIGTDHGLYISADGGEVCSALMDGLPHVPVHDLVTQERERHLIVGTHGRSIYKADLAPLDLMMNLTGDFALLPMDSLSGSERWGEAGWSKWFGTVTPSVDVYFTEQSTEVCRITVRDEKGMPFYKEQMSAADGLQRWSYNLQVQESTFKSDKRSKKLSLPKVASDGNRYLPAGMYSVDLLCGEQKASKTLIVR